MTIRADARDFSERLHVPLAEVRTHATYDAATDTIEPPAGPIALGYAVRDFNRACLAALETPSSEINRALRAFRRFTRSH